MEREEDFPTLFLDGLETDHIGPTELINKTISVCYPLFTNQTNPLIWNGDNTLDEGFFMLAKQMTLIVVLSRSLAYALKPLRQPKIVADILGGLLMGPTVLGRSQFFNRIFNPYNNIATLETMSDFGLIFFMFLVGVEMDISMVHKTGTKAIVIALGGLIAPFFIGYSYASSRNSNPKKQEFSMGFLLFFSVAVSVTAFPVLARVLAELKLLNTEVGQMALPSALVSDIFTWFIVIIAVAASGGSSSNGDRTAPLETYLVYTLYMFFIFFCVRPLLNRLARRIPEGEACKELDVCIVLVGVIFCCFLADAVGFPTLIGGFMYGLIVPIGPLGGAIVENLEDFVFGLLLPLFYAVNGLHTDLFQLISGVHTLLGMALLAGAAKVGATLLIGMYYKMEVQDGVALGLLMNIKGLVELIIINIARNQKVFDNLEFSSMVLVSVVTTCFVQPILMMFYRPARQTLPYKKRTIQSLKPTGELRVLACLHAPRNVPTTINLLEAAQPTTKIPVYLYALHLLELTDRESSMLMVHNIRKSGGVAVNRMQAQSEYILNTFQEYKQQGGVLSVEPMTAISPYSTMHEDIRNTAVEKRASLIILPFHKQQTIDGEMETIHPAYRAINQNILAKAPCSVGILVDRNLGSLKRTNEGLISQRVVLFFLGGPDDREALAFASRMVDNPAISLTIVRFLPGEEASFSPVQRFRRDETGEMVQYEVDDDGKVDDEFINNFLKKNMNKRHISFTEKTVNNGVETVDVIRSMDGSYDLYIVGRGKGDSMLTTGLTDWSECPELGVIGDILASPDFLKTASVLVVQQYLGS